MMLTEGNVFNGSNKDYFPTQCASIRENMSHVSAAGFAGIMKHHGKSTVAKLKGLWE